jgi:lipopolysaccharide/colanic/teichoic acid biosynthesis glycosyltransferase
VTGWAQINGRDELAIPDKVALDAEYLRRQLVLFDLTILVQHRGAGAHRSGRDALGLDPKT